MQVEGRFEGEAVRVGEVILGAQSKEIAFRRLGLDTDYDATAKTFLLLFISMKLTGTAKFDADMVMAIGARFLRRSAYVS
jgi:hypothetical protein